MNGTPYHEGQLYLLSSVASVGKSDSASTGHVIVTTEPIGGIVYRAVFSQAGESPSGRVVRCTVCYKVSD